MFDWLKELISGIGESIAPGVCGAWGTDLGKYLENHARLDL